MKSVEERIEDRKRATEFMIRMYCRKKHGYHGLCQDCRGLLDYACSRIDDCPNNRSGVRCSGCPIHCFRPDMRDAMRDVMGFCGPRMLLHPIMLRNWKRSPLKHILS